MGKPLSPPWRNNGKLVPGWIKDENTWKRQGVGRYWKRRLSKVRRRAWRDTHKRGLAQIESTVNWKDW
jgi:hypothetical protein